MNNSILSKNIPDRKIKIKLFVIMSLLSFVLFTALTGEGIIIPVFPLYLETFDSGSFELGLLIGAFSLTSLVLSPVIGSFSDKFGRKIFIILGLFGFSISNLLYLQASTFEELLLYRIIEGATAAGIVPIVNALLIDIIPSSHRGRYLGIVNGAGFLGVIIGPFIGGILIEHGNYATPFQISALIGLLGMILVIVILPNDYTKFKKLKNGKVKTPQYSLHQQIDFRKWILGGTTTLFVTIIFIRFAGIVSWTLIEPIVSFYLYDLNYDSLAVGLYFSCYGLTMFFGQITLGGLSDKFNRKTILQIGLALYLFGFMFLYDTEQIWNFYLSGALNGIGLALVIPSVVAILADITPNETNRGKVMGMYYGAFYFASIIGPILGGYLGNLFDFNFVLTISLCIVSIGLFISFKINLPRKSSQQILKEEINQTSIFI
jgi:MFS family permease